MRKPSGLSGTLYMSAVVLVVFLGLPRAGCLLGDEPGRKKADPKDKTQQTPPQNTSSESTGAPSGAFPQAASTQLDKAMVAGVIAECLPGLKAELRKKPEPGWVRTNYSTSPDGRVRSLKIKLGGKQYQIRHNWVFYFRWSQGGGPKCDPPGKGAFIKTTEPLPLAGFTVPAETFLVRGDHRWEVASPDQVPRGKGEW